MQLKWFLGLVGVDIKSHLDTHSCQLRVQVLQDEWNCNGGGVISTNKLLTLSVLPYFGIIDIIVLAVSFKFG